MFSACNLVKIGAYEPTLLLCHLEHIHGIEVKVCSAKKCMFRTAMPHLKYRLIKIAHVDLDDRFTYVGDLLHLPKTKKIVKIVNATNACKNLRTLAPSNNISYLRTPIPLPQLCIPTGSDIAARIAKYITEVHYREMPQELQRDVICHTNESMLRDRDCSFCSASAVFGDNVPCNSFFISVEIPDKPPSSF
jgi:hypothetical protein